MIFIEKRGSKIERIAMRHPNAQLFDMTSRGVFPYIRLSPLYPHGLIPVPFSPGVFCESVEAMWQALKVFDDNDIDLTLLSVRAMKNIRRLERDNGRLIGYRKGVNGKEVLEYEDAMSLLYIPTYEYTLQTYLQNDIAQLRAIAEKKDIVLLDNEVNDDKIFSHAKLVKMYIEEGMMHDAASV